MAFTRGQDNAGWQAANPNLEQPKVIRGYENNWVKTIPGRGWWVWFRFYSPTEAFFDKTWQLLDFDKIDG